jgi:hypothetical protein
MLMTDCACRNSILRGARMAYPAYGRASVYPPRAGAWQGLAEARMGVMQNQLLRWAAQRDMTRESINRHSSWLKTLKGEVSSALFHGKNVLVLRLALDTACATR